MRPNISWNEEPNRQRAAARKDPRRRETTSDAGANRTGGSKQIKADGLLTLKKAPRSSHPSTFTTLSR